MYITIEGPEATGKTTQAELLYSAIQNHNFDRKVLLTKEPGSNLDNVCSDIRSLLLNPQNDIADKSALLLFLADRAQHMAKVIKPFLKEGGIVISDRSSLSSLVYHLAQTITSNNPEKIDHTYLFEIIDFAQGIQPDLCFITQSNYHWSLSKLKERDNLDRIESFSEEFHQKVHYLFQEIATQTLPSTKELTFVRSAMKTFPKQVYLLPSCVKAKKEQIASAVWEKVSSGI